MKPSLSRPVSNAFPYLRVANVQRGTLDLREIAKFELFNGELDRLRLRRGDLLVVEGNGSETEIGRCARWDGEIDDCVHQNHIIRCRPLADGLDQFVLRFLNSPIGMDIMKALAVTTSGLYTLSVGKVRSITVPVPPLAEQRRIVARVDELMGLLDRLEAAGTVRDATRVAVRDSALNALQEADKPEEVEVAWKRLAERMDDLLRDPADITPLRQTVLQLAVRGRLVPQDPTDEPASVLLKRIAAEKARLVRAGKVPKQEPLSPAREETVPFSVPKGWEWARIADLSALVTDGVHKTPSYVSNGVPFLSIKDISGGSIDFSDTRFITEAEHAEINKRCNPEKGDILFCRIGTLGKAVVVDTERPFSLFVSVGLIKHTGQLSSHFLCMALNSPTTYMQYDRIKAGGSHTEKLNLGPMRAVIVPVPPLAEQQRIVARVDELMGLLDRLEERLAAARTAHAAFAAAAVHHLNA